MWLLMDGLLAKLPCKVSPLGNPAMPMKMPFGPQWLQKMLGYRIFEDANGKMNLSVRDIAGGLLLVPQFTLAADTRKGCRPGFSAAADPQVGKRLFDYLREQAGQQYSPVACGRFGMDMQVSLVNQGPATFWLQA